jgi:hypothetical protein
MRRAGRKMGRVLPLVLLLIAGIAAAAGMSGCGGSSSPPAPVTYNIQVTGTSGSLTHTADVSLTVQ